MGSMFDNYEAKELDKDSKFVYKRIEKMMNKCVKYYGKTFIDTVKITDLAWRNAIKYYSNVNLKIETKSTINAVYNAFSEELRIIADLKDEHMIRFMVNTTDDAEAEHNSKDVVDFILKELGIETKRSAFSGKKLILKGNIITDGKKLNTQFL